MKIFTTIILSTIIIFYNSNAIAETKQDCSMYSNKTYSYINLNAFFYGFSA